MELSPVFIERLKEESPDFSETGYRVARRRQGRHSELLEFQDSDLVVKRITRSRTPATARATVVREFSALNVLAKRLSLELRGTIPRALLVLPDSNTLVLGRVPGTPLRQIMKLKANRLTGWWWGRGASEIGFRVGEWLRKFHASTAQEDVVHDHDAYFEKLTRQVAQCRAVRLGDAAAEILERANEISQRNHGKRVPAAARHGDFIPQNILVGASGVSLVDFENFSEQAMTFEDAADFVAYNLMLTGRPFYSQRSLEAMNAGFFAGYGPITPEAVFNLHVLKAQATNAAMFQPAKGFWRRLGNFHRFRARLLSSARGL